MVEGAESGELSILRHDTIPEDEIPTTSEHDADSKSTNFNPSSDLGTDEPSFLVEKWAARVFKRFWRKNPDRSLFHSPIPMNHVMTPIYPLSDMDGLEPASDHRSVTSRSTYFTALSRRGGQGVRDVPGQLKEGDEYARLLQSQKLWPVDPLFEQNWSGRGQHAEFKKHEQKLIDEILEVQENLGTTRTAFVQSVKCRRILLARKTIMCGKQTMTKKEAIAEVSHLTQLNHAHILRIIGTYVKGRELSILLYPVADCNLENFLGIYHNNFRIPTGVTPEVGFLVDCFGCLSSAVRYIHRNLTKHMDIKPQNILVQKSPVAYTLFIADFGIARSYAKLEETETDGATSFTKRYAAPEVVKQEHRGLPADIFSLGCVFLEVYDALYWPWNREQNISGLQACLDANPSGDTSYQANIDTLQAEVWRFATLDWRGGPRPSLIVKMLNHHPLDRPTAEMLVFALGERHCCSGGSIALQALANDHSDSEKPDI